MAHLRPTEYPRPRAVGVEGECPSPVIVVDAVGPVWSGKDYGYCVGSVLEVPGIDSSVVGTVVVICLQSRPGAVSGGWGSIGQACYSSYQQK